MGSIIENLKGKIKFLLENEQVKDVLLVLILIITGLLSFELGRLSKNDTNRGIILKGDQNSVLEKKDSNMTNNDSSNSNLINKNYFASSKGTKYYSIGCSAGKDIKQENRIYFSSKEEAEKAGYTLSSSCR